MGHSETGSTEPTGAAGDGHGLSRRNLARAAAWSVPAILVAAPAPAYAASTGGGASIATTTAVCGAGTAGTISVSLTNLPLGSTIQIALTHTGSGSFTATPNFTPTSQSGTTYVVTGAAADFSGSFAITFTGIGQNGIATVTATVSAISGVQVVGDTTASIRKRRDGNSQNYECSTT